MSIKGGLPLTNILAISLLIISGHKPGSDGIISTLALLKPSSKVSHAAGISVADITELLTQAELTEVDCSSAIDEDGVITSSGSASVEAVLLLQPPPLVTGPDVTVDASVGISDGPLTVADIMDSEIRSHR
ncbi:unnamed protein product [Parnassius apollo]|uniref:(apollo) hypothetical protein n=1 Tax=Parnassius apollo TaxID=110799 RepID=A0A8S3XCM0_PARAO|nr:unnamed protein product [Parnassius apollo]